MTNCCVFGCSHQGGHLFPKDITMRRKWIHLVRRKNWKPTARSVVCKSHFHPSAYVKEGFESGMMLVRKILKVDAVPTIFSWKENKSDNSTSSARKKRLESRASAKNNSSIQVEEALIEEGLCPNSLDETDIGREEIVHDVMDCSGLARTQVPVPTFSEIGCQTFCEEPRFSISQFVNNPKAIHFYTGLENYAKFSLVFQTLGPAVHELNYHGSTVLSPSVENQFFLTLIKLRLNKQLYELSLFFEISECTVSNIINTWIPFMALQWGELNIWPTAKLVQYYMPADFKRKFPSTRVIMDGTEMHISKPTEPNAQQVTFSTYKNHNTLKVLVGVTPGGLISYCSDAYGGSASDRQIVERSLLVDMCSPGDSIMADRGFNVQDLFACRDVSINIPSFLKGKSQLPGITVVHDRKIASKRVHVERIIGMTKTYKILKHELNTNFIHLGSQIYFVCAMLCNFRECIVGRHA